MSDSKTRTEIERLVEGLDEVPVSDAEGHDTVKRLGIDTKVWAASIRARVTAADAAQRRELFDQAKQTYLADVARLASRPSEPTATVEEQRRKVKALLAMAPREAAVSMHFHKFEEATAAELAEMIKSLRHLLGEDADDDEIGE